jgi:hypothetical protein
MALRYCDNISIAVRMVGREVMAVEDNKTWERLKIHAVHLVCYMGKCEEGLQTMPEESEAGNDGIASPTNVQWLANPPTIREMRQ